MAQSIEFNGSFNKELGESRGHIHCNKVVKQGGYMYYNNSSKKQGRGGDALACESLIA